VQNRSLCDNSYNGSIRNHLTVRLSSTGFFHIDNFLNAYQLPHYPIVKPDIILRPGARHGKEEHLADLRIEQAKLITLWIDHDNVVLMFLANPRTEFNKPGPPPPPRDPSMPNQNETDSFHVRHHRTFETI